MFQILYKNVLLSPYELSRKTLNKLTHQSVTFILKMAIGTETREKYVYDFRGEIFFFSLLIMAPIILESYFFKGSCSFKAAAGVEQYEPGHEPAEAARRTRPGSAV